MTTFVREIIKDWPYEDIENLGKLLGIESDTNHQKIEEKIKWLYHSKTMASIESNTKNLITKIFSSSEEESSPENTRRMPTYEELIYGACQHLKTFEEGATLEENEYFLSIAVIISALNNMKPRERESFFKSQIEIEKLASGAKISDADLSSTFTTFALLGAAQASGFGVYVATTTALGFLTHAVGITLPFAVYGGLTSTIAFVIGPVGWLAAGALGAYQFTKTEWKSLIPALVYITSIRAKNVNPSRIPDHFDAR